MKILVLSDSHGMISRVYDAYETVRPDLLIHLGDRSEDIDRVVSFGDVKCDIVLVKGNCDLTLFGAPKERVLDIDGVKLFCVHGHEQRVKSGLDALTFAAKSRNCTYALYGHTHVKSVDEINGVTCINPGAVGFSGTYTVIEIKNGQLEILN